MLQNKETIYQLVHRHDIPFPLHISGKYKSIPLHKTRCLMIKEEPNVWHRSPRNCLSQNPVASAPLHLPKALLHSQKYSRRYPRSTDNRQQTLKYRCFLRRKPSVLFMFQTSHHRSARMRSHHPSDYLHRVIRSAVIHKNNFQIRPGLVQHSTADTVLCTWQHYKPEQ